MIQYWENPVLFLSGSDNWSDHFFMCVFPKVLIIIMDYMDYINMDFIKRNKA